MKLTPVELTTLLLIYYDPVYAAAPRAPAVAAAVEKLHKLKLLETDAIASLRTTEKGTMHVKQLCTLGLPTEQTTWVDANGEVLEL